MLFTQRLHYTSRRYCRQLFAERALGYAVYGRTYGALRMIRCAVGEVPLMSYQTLLSNTRFPLFPYFWPGGREGAASQRGSKSKRRKCVNVCPHTDLSTFKRRERQRPKEAIASYAEIDSCDEGFLHAAFAISSTTRPQARSRTLLLLWSTFRLRLIRFGQ